MALDIACHPRIVSDRVLAWLLDDIAASGDLVVARVRGDPYGTPTKKRRRASDCTVGEISVYSPRAQVVLGSACLPRKRVLCF